MGKLLYHGRALVTPPARTPEEREAWVKAKMARRAPPSADRPILFSPPMVRSLLREIEQPGTGKTQTRRVLVPQPQWDDEVKKARVDGLVWPIGALGQQCGGPLKLPPFQPGERLWCREEHFQFGHWEMAAGKKTKGGRERWQFVPDTDEVLLDPPSEFRRGRHHHDPGTPAWHKRLGRFMFRRHSRLTLYVTDVRVERLQDISNRDAEAEGVHRHVRPNGGLLTNLSTGEVQSMTVTTYSGAEGMDTHGMPRRAFRDLWDSIKGSGAWDANPWVAAYTFVPVLGNITTLPAALADLPSHAEGTQP